MQRPRRGRGALLRIRSGDWEGTREYGDLGAKHIATDDVGAAPFATRRRGTRACRIHTGRRRRAALLESMLALLDRATRPIEVATLSVRAAGPRCGRRAPSAPSSSRSALRRPTRRTSSRGSSSRAHPQKSAATPSARPKRTRASHAPRRPTSTRLVAWYDAACAYGEDERAIAAFEQAASINVTHQASSSASRSSTRRRARAPSSRRYRASHRDRARSRRARSARGRSRSRTARRSGRFRAAAREAYDAALAVQPDHIWRAPSDGRSRRRSERLGRRRASMPGPPRAPARDASEEQLGACTAAQNGDLYAEEP